MSETGEQLNSQLGDTAPVEGPQPIGIGPLDEGAPLSADSTPQLGDTSPGIVVIASSQPDSKRTSRRRHWLIAGLALLIAAVTAVVVIFALTSGGTSYKVAHGPVWTTVQNGRKVSVVTVVVKNTGKTVASPTCVIRATYLGAPLKAATITETPPIQPGGVRIYINPVPIPAGSAKFFKKSDITVTCH